MKFPTLSRMMSIVLCVLSLVLILTGILGIRSAEEDRDEALKKRDLLSARRDTYIEYSDILSGRGTYTDASAEYEEEKTVYDEKAAQHRSDLAIYSATKGGLEEARQAMQESVGPMVYAQSQLATYQDQYNQLVAGIQGQGFSADEAGLAQVNALVAQYSAMLNDEAAITAQAAAQVDAMIAQVQEGVNQAAAAVAAAQAAYDQAVAGGASEEELAALAAQVAAAQAARDAAQAQLDQLVAGRDAAIAMAVEQIKAGYSSAVSGYSQLAGYIGMAMQLAAGIAQGEQAMMFGYGALSLGRIEIEKAEKELPDKLATLENEKAELDEEIEKLRTMENVVSALRTDEEKLKSTRLILEANDNIMTMVQQGTELTEAARLEIERMTSETEQEYNMRLLMNVLLLAAALFGLLTIPCAFEKISSHTLLILSALLFTLLPLISETISLKLGRGNLYSALVASAFGLISLLVMIPKERTAEAPEKEV